MGKQAQEQTKFDGFVSTGKGATTPRWSAADEVNIDHQFRTIKGREPSRRVSDHELPQVGYYCDGIASYVDIGTFDATTTTRLGSADFQFRVYVGGIDSERLSDTPSGTKFCIADITGNSTLVIDTPLSGFTMYYESTGSSLNLIVKFRSTTLQTLTLDMTGLLGKQEFHCIEFSRLSSNWTWKLRVFDSADNKLGEDTVTPANFNMTVNTIAEVKLGAFAVTGTTSMEHRLEGVLGGVVVMHAESDDSGDTDDRFMAFDRVDIPSSVSWSLFFEQGQGYGESASSSVDDTTQVTLRPLPPKYAIDRVGVWSGSWGELDMSGINTDTSKGWMTILDFEVPAQTLDPDAAPWLLNMGFTFLAAVYVSSTQYKITCSMGTFLANGLIASNASVTTANLNFSNRYKVAMVITPKYGARVIDMDLYLWTTGGGWVLVGSDNTVTGLPRSDNRWFFGSNKNQVRFMDVEYLAFRLFNNFDSIPANATDITNLDSYPTDVGGPSVWPARIAASFEARSDSDIVKELSITPAFNTLRVVSWRDDFNGRYTINFKPDYGINRWSCFVGLSRGHRPRISGVAPAVQTIADVTRKFIHYLLPGGVYRYNQDDETGVWLQHPEMSGCVCSGVVTVESKDRQIFAGKGFNPVKVYPGGVANVGLEPPEMAVQQVSSSAGDFGLEASTTYKFKVTVYNSATGQESNAMDSILSFGTSVGENTIDLKIIVSSIRGGSDDWDMIRFYRFSATGFNEYYLDTEIPRPRLLPPLGADIEFTVGQAEADLLLQKIIEDDNHVPPNFTSATVANRTMYIGVGGYVMYSKVLFLESFPPINVFQLDDDESNSVMALVSIFGRLLIFKQRGIWGAADNAADTGQDPQLLHADRGLASPRGWATADNLVFFISPDRAIYATDGLEIDDVSSALIKDTMLGYSEEQIVGAQMIHDARSKSIWILIPNGSSVQGAHREVLCYRYDHRRWQRYEFPCDSIANGHDSETSGVYGGFGFRGSFYRLVDGDTNEESDAGEGQSTFTYDYDDDDANEAILEDRTGQVVGVQTDTLAWDPSCEGMPCIVVPHDTAYDPDDPESYHPLWDSSPSDRIYNYVRGARTEGAVESLYFGESFTNTARYLWVGVGFQYRKYVSQWITPQGEERPHMFYGGSFVHAPGHAVSTTDPRFRYSIDHEVPAPGGWLNISAEPRFPDTSHELRRRSRRFKYEICQGDGRGKLLEISRVSWRYRVRGPRRKR